MADPAPTTLAQATADLQRALAAFQHALGDSGAASTGPVFEALRRWRTKQARAQNVPPYIVASDAVLRAIEQARPADQAGLQTIKGIGPHKAEQYGPDLLAVLAQAAAAAP